MSANLWPEYASRIAGGWKCVSYEMFDLTNDKLTKPHGDSPLGRVLISPKGFLSAHMARPERMGPLPSGKPWQTGEDKEVAHVARGMSMYCGYLELFEDADGLFWQTRVEVCSDPARLGGLEIRRIEFLEEGGKQFMVLRPKRDMFLEDGTNTRAVLKWEKFE